MTLNQLEYFCTVCRYHSITRAAEILFVSQPTISMSIRKLEEEFGLSLFRHNGNRIELTQEGMEFCRMAETLLQQSQDMYTEFAKIAGGKWPLKIGIPPLISTIFFPRMIDAFQAENDIPVQLFEYGSVRACSLVDSGELDVALVNMDYYNIDELNHHVIMEDDYVFCVSRTHRLAKSEQVTFSMLADEQIIVFNTDSVQNATVDAGFRGAGLRPNIFMHCSQLGTILNFVRGGQYGAFLYSRLAVNPRDFVLLPVSPRITSRFGVVWKKGGTPSIRTSKFVTFAKKYKLI